jgi:hypothetical protein
VTASAEGWHHFGDRDGDGTAGPDPADAVSPAGMDMCGFMISTSGGTAIRLDLNGGDVTGGRGASLVTRGGRTGSGEITIANAGSVSLGTVSTAETLRVGGKPTGGVVILHDGALRVGAVTTELRGQMGDFNASSGSITLVGDAGGDGAAGDLVAGVLTTRTATRRNRVGSNRVHISGYRNVTLRGVDTSEYVLTYSRGEGPGLTVTDVTGSITVNGRINCSHRAKRPGKVPDRGDGPLVLKCGERITLAGLDASRLGEIRLSVTLDGAVARTASQWVWIRSDPLHLETDAAGAVTGFASVDSDVYYTDTPGVGIDGTRKIAGTPWRLIALPAGRRPPGP